MKLSAAVASLGAASMGLAFVVLAQQTRPPAAPLQAREALAGFDGLPNGMVDPETFASDQAEFDGVEGPDDGVGPTYNAQSCRECHQNPISGGASQITELRVGHRGAGGRFENPRIPINGGKDVIVNRSLVNDRAICPEAQQRVPDSETIRTLRLSLNVLGDGFIEAVADQTLVDLARQQCATTRGRICGQVINVPIIEAPGETRAGRFGWKNQHASLVSFSADAYLNEMGVTSRLLPDEVTEVCNTVASPNSVAAPGEDIDDVGRFARFIRATKAPPRDAALAASDRAKRGEVLFGSVGCATCHTPTLTTAPPGTLLNGKTFTVPDALGSRQFHPYSDFLLHDVGTGDGIVMSPEEHHGRNMRRIRWRNFSDRDLESTQYKLRTPPLWGVRMRTRLMHDGASLTLTDAIVRHRGEAAEVAQRYQSLGASEREAMVEFLRSL
jgi:CxxC motif-containing protein (DUF1111 family)